MNQLKLAQVYICLDIVQFTSETMLKVAFPSQRYQVRDHFHDFYLHFILMKIGPNPLGMLFPLCLSLVHGRNLRATAMDSPAPTQCCVQVCVRNVQVRAGLARRCAMCMRIAHTQLCARTIHTQKVYWSEVMFKQVECAERTQREICGVNGSEFNNKSPYMPKANELIFNSVPTSDFVYSF